MTAIATAGATRIAGYQCLRCGETFDPDLAIDSSGCPLCASAGAPANLSVLVSDRANTNSWRESGQLASLWRFEHTLPCVARDAVSLGEGLTPLLEAHRLGRDLGLSNLLVKDESKNPTWSHKDRFSTVAVSVAKLNGAKVVATASSGNAGASLAAYAARAGLQCVVATFAGTSGTMNQQIRKYGAAVVKMASKADRWDLLEQGRKKHGWMVVSPSRAPVVGSHPIGIEGYKTLAFEIVEQMNGRVPDWCVLPVCYGDALVGLWRGFEALRRAGRIRKCPRLVAAEIHGSLGRALAEGADTLHPPMSVHDTLAVSIGAACSTYQALSAIRGSNGMAVQVSDDTLIELQERLAMQEGLLAELASVTPLAAIQRLVGEGVMGASDTVVAVATGSGLKDLDRSSLEPENEPVFRSSSEALAFLSRPQDVRDRRR